MRSCLICRARNSEASASYLAGRINYVFHMENFFFDAEMHMNEIKIIFCGLFVTAAFAKR